MLDAAGREIALHVHPRWKDSRWHDVAWDICRRRFQLGDFSREKIVDIYTTYSNCLGEPSGMRPSVYRARQSWVEPFDRIGQAMAQGGLSMDQWGVDLARRPAKSIRELIADDGQYECSNDSTRGQPVPAKQLKTKQ